MNALQKAAMDREKRRKEKEQQQNESAQKSGNVEEVKKEARPPLAEREPDQEMP